MSVGKDFPLPRHNFGGSSRIPAFFANFRVASRGFEEQGRLPPKLGTVSENVRGSLKDSEFPLFVIQRYMDATGKECTAALQFILERWAMLDPDAERYGVRLEDFKRARDQAKVTELPTAARRAEKPSA